MVDVNVNAPADQAPTMAPPTRIDDQILPHIRWRKHNFYSRPDSPLHLPNKEPVLGYLKFSAKGTKREVFRMPISGNLITADIQGKPYYQEYLEKVAKHQRYLACEQGSDPDSPTPKPAKTTKKSKSSNPKADPRPPLSSARRSKPGLVTKRRKPTSSLRSVDESVAEGILEKEPRFYDEEADVQRALEESLKSIYDTPHGLLPPVVIKEPEFGKYQPLPEVQGKGKEKVTDEQVACDLLTLQTPKKKSPADQFIFQRRTSTPTGSSGHDESSSLYDEIGLTDSKVEYDEDVLRIDTRVLDEGQAGPNPGDAVARTSTPTGSSGHDESSSLYDEIGLTDSKVEYDEDVLRIDTRVLDEGQAGPNPDVSTQPHLEQMDEGFTATAYPKVQKNLKLTVEEQVILEEPASSTGTLSSLQHLAKDLSFGDLFFNDKPSEVDNEKITAETKAESMSLFLRYVDTRPNDEALRKCILSGPYKPTTVLVQVVEATVDSPAVSEHTTVETPMNVYPENKAYFLAEKEATHLILTGIGDEIYSIVDACQTAQEMFVTIVKQQHKLDEVSYHKLFDILKQYQNEVNELRAKRSSAQPLIPSRSHTTTRHKGKEIAKPITPPSETASEEDNDPEQAQRDKDMQKNLALIAKYFKKIYKPTNNNLRISLNSKNKNVDTTPQFKIDNQSGQFGNQRTVNVAAARENVGSKVVQQSGIQCFNCKQYGHFAKECRKPKRVKDSMYHKEKMLMCKQAEQGVPLRFSQQTQASILSQWNSNTCLVETDDSNVIPDSPDMCEDDIQNEQNDVDSDDERVALANLIANLKLDVDENKTIQKQLKKANTTLAQELKECKTILAETSKSLRESICVRDSCLVSLQTKQTGFEKYKAFNDHTIDYDKLKRKLNEALGLLAHKDTGLLTKSHYEGLVKQKMKVIMDLKLREEHDIEKMLFMEKQLKFLNEIFYKKSINPNHSYDGTQEIVDNAWTKQSKDQFRAPTAQDIEILTQTCLMPLAIKTQNDSFKFVRKLKQEMHADLKYVESLEKEIDELKSDKAEFSDMYDVILQECVSKEVMCSYLMSLSDLDTLSELQCMYLHKVKECDCLAQKLSKQTESVSKKVHTELLQRFAKVEKHLISLELTLQKCKEQIVQLILFSVDSRCTKHMTRNLKLLCNFVEKFLGTVRFGNDQFAPILGYGDLVHGNVTINKVYYVEGLNHNLFSVGQFCDADLEVAFRKSTCFVRDLQGNDLLTGNRGSDLYTISLQESTSSTPLCLMAKATPTQAWLWHQRLSHFNFDYINLLLKKDIVIGLPKLKLNLLHMDLCGPMRVASINGKKYNLVIVDDYSRYTWTLFLRLKDETPKVLKEFLTMIQRNLQASVITVRTDRCTEFLNKTLNAFFKEEGIEHQTSTARTPEHNGIVKRQNHTLVVDARTMLSALQLPLFFWAEAFITACYTQNQGSNLQDQQPSTNIPSTSAPSTHTNVHAEEKKNDQAEEGEQLQDNEFTNPLCALTQGVFERRFMLHNHPDHLEKIYRLRKALHGLKQASMAWYDELLKFLTSKGFTKGLQIHQSPSGIFINQAKYTFKILHKHGMDKDQSIGTPMATKPKLDAELSGNPVDQTEYHSKIGSLMYLTSSRPDIVQAVENGIIELYFVRTEYQLADMFTKAFPEDRFKYLVRCIVLRYDGDECDKGRMPTKIELTLEQSQQGVSNDVLVSIEGVEELKRHETNSYKTHEDHMMLYEALKKSMNRDYFEELLKDLAEARKKKKKRCDSPKMPHGSPPHQPPPPPPPTGPSGTSGSPRASGSSQVLPTTPPPPSTNQEDLQMDDDMAPDAQAHSFDDEDIGNAYIPKASTLASTYSPPPEDSLLVQTYQIEECHKLLIDNVDDLIIMHNVSKPLPLGGLPGQVTIHSDFFFNKYLEYLRYGSKGSRPALSISKMKAAYYPDVGLEQMVPDQMWIDKECKYDIAALYGHLNHLPPKDKKILTTLNLTKPRWDATGFEYKHDYMVIDSPRAVTFRDRYGVQMIMRFNEIHKFSDGTLH
nr:putative ribonuclease H-like domain-containing protein [Tanacetum cinerariifolium]